MALLKAFKKKEKEEKKEKVKKEKKGRKEGRLEKKKMAQGLVVEEKKEAVRKKTEKKAEEESKKKEAEKTRPEKREIKTAPYVLLAPQVTEKATELQKENKYIFKVRSGSTKNEIKKAIEEVYGVVVVSVRTIRVPRRRKRLGRSVGWKKGYKKAIVSIRKGQSIEILPK